MREEYLRGRITKDMLGELVLKLIREDFEAIAILPIARIPGLLFYLIGKIF
jgi:hypothetical protein